MIRSCPNRDGFLKSYTTTGKNGLPITYHRCPHCRGTWASGFAANFLADVVEHERPPAVVHPPLLPPLCPECKALLLPLRSDNVPAAVRAFRCPHGHGYFFPAGELTKFKTAQQAKIDYHKLWNIPLPSVASILLASVAVILFTGLAASLWGIQQKQVLESRAQSILVSQRAVITTQGSVVFFVQTRVPAVVILHIPVWENYQVTMESTDGLTHTATVSTLPPGTYRYYVVIERERKQTQSDQFLFSIPSP